MTEGTRLFGQGKKSKTDKRVTTSPKKARNFVARYSDENDESPRFEVGGALSSFRLGSQESSAMESVEAGPERAPFVTGQGETFKILDDDTGPDFEEQVIEDAAAPGDPTEAFRLAEEESLKFLDDPAPAFSSDDVSDNESFTSHFEEIVEKEEKVFPSDRVGLDAQSQEFSLATAEEAAPLYGETEALPPLMMGEHDDGAAPEAAMNIDFRKEGDGRSLFQEEGSRDVLPQSEHSFAPDPSEEINLHPCLVSFFDPDSFEAKQYQTLRSLVERLKEKKDHAYVVAVTSPSVGDGKTTTALNLAGAFAQQPDTRVLLVDADLLSPSISERLGDKGVSSKGFAEILSSPRVRWKNALVSYSQLNLTVLPAGRTTSSLDVFSSPRLGALLNEARREYDYIILDLPPVPAVPDYPLIENRFDGAFLIVAAHKTPRVLVQESLSVMSEEKILGLVFNGGELLAEENLFFEKEEGNREENLEEKLL